MNRDTRDEWDHIFRPRSIAVIGASATPGKWGYLMVDRLLKAGYEGAIYPISSKIHEILGLRAYSNISAVPGSIDLAVMTVPSAAIPGVVDECLERGVKGAVVISAGFAEVGEGGRRLQDKMTKAARSGGMRLVGPNCMGIWSAGARVNLCFQDVPKTGEIAFVSQSGSFGTTIAQAASEQGHGLSKFISVGNQADLETCDYLEYLAKDPDTKVIVLYLEGLKDGRRFLNVVRKVIGKKPIVVYKGGRSPAGLRATLSHTASIAGSDKIFNSVCKQGGLLRVDEFIHLFEMAEALLDSPLASGSRVAILGSGGQGVIGTDACASLGLEVPQLDADTAAAISELLPIQAPWPTNPVDFAGSNRSAITEAEIVEKLLRLDYIDGIISNVPVSPQLWGYSRNIDPKSDALPSHIKTALEGARVYASLPKKYNKPIICLRFRRLENDIMEEIITEGGIPIYNTPEQCARGMYALVEYGSVRRRQC